MSVSSKALSKAVGHYRFKPALNYQKTTGTFANSYAYKDIVPVEKQEQYNLFSMIGNFTPEDRSSLAMK